MKHSRFARPVMLLLLAFLSTSGASAQQAYQLSSKFYEMEFVHGNTWNGQHHFGNVFCLAFPRSTEATAIAEAMYNNNALYFSRASYRDLTALYVVTSTVPTGRSIEVEIGNLESQNQKSVDAYPANFKQTKVMGLLGPSLALTIRNSMEGAKDKPFPFMRSAGNHVDGQLRSLSIHRLFVRGSDRIEVAGLRYFKTPIAADGETEAISALSALVESTADSLQSCTVKLPPRVQ